MPRDEAENMVESVPKKKQEKVWRSRATGERSSSYRMWKKVSCAHGGGGGGDCPLLDKVSNSSSTAILVTNSNYLDYLVFNFVFKINNNTCIN